MSTPADADAARGDLVRRRVIVSGRVQGVFFRDTCRRVARDHGLSGLVRNRADGSVEAVFEGPSAAVVAIITWCRHGPPSAIVTGVTVTDEPPLGETGFIVR